MLTACSRLSRLSFSKCNHVSKLWFYSDDDRWIEIEVLKMKLILFGLLFIIFYVKFPSRLCTSLDLPYILYEVISHTRSDSQYKTNHLSLASFINSDFAAFPNLFLCFTVTSAIKRIHLQFSISEKLLLLSKRSLIILQKRICILVTLCTFYLWLFRILKYFRCWCQFSQHMSSSLQTTA